MEGEPEMGSVTSQEAEATPGDLIRRLTPGEKVVITEDDQPGWRRLPRHARLLGWERCGGQEGFDEPLEVFQV